MKIKFFLTVILICTIMPLAPAFAMQGSEGIGGGDDVGFEFQMTYMTALDDIRANSPELQQQFDQANLGPSVARARIFVVNGVLPVRGEGIEQDVVATNDPASGIITVSRARWIAIQDPMTRIGIALHEVLSLAHLEQTGFYPLSTEYVLELKKRNKN